MIFRNYQILDHLHIPKEEERKEAIKKYEEQMADEESVDNHMYYSASWGVRGNAAKYDSTKESNDETVFERRGVVTLFPSTEPTRELRFWLTLHPTYETDVAKYGLEIPNFIREDLVGMDKYSACVDRLNHFLDTIYVCFRRQNKDQHDRIYQCFQIKKKDTLWFRRNHCLQTCLEKTFDASLKQNVTLKLRKTTKVDSRGNICFHPNIPDRDTNIQQQSNDGIVGNDGDDIVGNDSFAQRVWNFFH